MGQGTPGVNLNSIVGVVPTALAAALVFPQSTFWAFQAKDNTKLIASTQVHAFNGEESTARIGQRVPVQTAQAYPFGVQTGQPATGTNFPTGGFPVINYEPTGLTLKFTPQVFTNLDVQVKMSIESKDVLAARYSDAHLHRADNHGHGARSEQSDHDVSKHSVAIGDKRAPRPATGRFDSGLRSSIHGSDSWCSGHRRGDRSYSQSS